jgi:hypothetical protein
VLSSDNLLGSAGGVVIQPALGRAAVVWSYGQAYVVSAGIQLLAVPFILLARSAGNRQSAGGSQSVRDGQLDDDGVALVEGLR